MTDSPWTADDIPDQSGRTAVITGANTGLGFEAARILAHHGAAVVLACRNPEKAAEAADRIRLTAPDSIVTILSLDQASLTSVHAAAKQLRAEHQEIDLLINNAGMLGSSARRLTEDGFEATFATNHLGVFAFTGLVLDRLLAVPGSRVVTLSSLTHRSATIDFDDLQSERRYRRNSVYGRSKLANLLFTHELQRRLAAAGAPTIATAAHPGQSRTEFTRDINPAARFLYGPHARPLTGWLMQDPAIGALATIRAAVDPHAHGGEYYGPAGPLGLTGHPVKIKPSARSRDISAQGRLWQESERLTNVTYSLATGSPQEPHAQAQ